MKKKALLLMLFLLVTPSLVMGTTWIPDETTEIQQNLYSGYEPSGIVYHPYHDLLFLVGDAGDVTKMNTDGSGVTSWAVGGDLEGITFIPGSEYVYVAVEYPFEILKVDPTAGGIVSTVELTPPIIPSVTDTTLGIEALTFVPNNYHPYDNSSNGGLFYLGVQEDGRVHVVDVNFGNQSAVLIDSFMPVPGGRTDLSGLYYSQESEILYVLYDSANKIREITTSNAFLIEYYAPGRRQEGITLLPACPGTDAQLFITEDSGKVMRYDGFPFAHADTDSDDVRGCL